MSDWLHAGYSQYLSGYDGYPHKQPVSPHECHTWSYGNKKRPWTRLERTLREASSPALATTNVTRITLLVCANIPIRQNVQDDSVHDAV